MIRRRGREGRVVGIRDPLVLRRERIVDDTVAGVNDARIGLLEIDELVVDLLGCPVGAIRVAEFGKRPRWRGTLNRGVDGGWFIIGSGSCCRGRGGIRLLIVPETEPLVLHP